MQRPIQTFERFRLVRDGRGLLCYGCRNFQRLNETEQRLIPALQTLQSASASPLSLIRLALKGASGEAVSDEKNCLARLGFDGGGMKNTIYGYLLRGALRSEKSV